MKRLCFLSPDTDHTFQVVKDLKEFGIPEKHIYVIGKSDIVGQHDERLQGLSEKAPRVTTFWLPISAASHWEVRAGYLPAST